MNKQLHKDHQGNGKPELTKNWLDQTDRKLHPTTAQYAFSSSAQETFSRTSQKLGHKSSLNKLKRSEIIQSMFFDHKEMKLQISNKKIHKRGD